MSENQKKRILIVEDDEMVRSFVTIHMENHGFEVHGVATGKAFFSALDNGSVDLIVLDLNLPDGDGLDFAAELRKTDNTPIIIASTRKGMDDRLTALNLGSIDYVTKPFDPQELVLRIKNLLAITENSDTTTSPNSQPQNTAANSQLKYLAFGAIAALVIIVVAGIAWNIGKPTPKATPAQTAEVKIPAPAVQPLPASPPPQEMVSKQVTIPAPTVKAPGECATVPDVSWWSNKTHLSIRVYVERRYRGDWAPYIKTWNRRLDKLVDIMGRNSSAVASSGIVLSGAELGDYIAKVEKRISIIKCLSGKKASK